MEWNYTVTFSQISGYSTSQTQKYHQHFLFEAKEGETLFGSLQTIELWNEMVLVGTTDMLFHKPIEW